LAQGDLTERRTIMLVEEKTAALDRAEQFRVLVVDDVVMFARAVASALENRNMLCDLATNCEQALELAGKNSYQAIVLDQRLPDGLGVDLIPRLLSRQHKCPLIVQTAYENIAEAVEAIRRGAEDYLIKQTSLEPLVERLQEIRARHLVRAQRSGWSEHRRDGLFGNSPAVNKVREQLRKVAAQPLTTVLITGETGVGKEVAARYLHQLTSPEAPFLSVDCVALPANLMESLLFGHERGAFTGAERTTEGLLQAAGGGTVLLDEIGDMDLALQGKLLRVLESRSFHRIGSTQEIPLRGRVIAATHRDLEQLVAQGRFRQDLYQRLAVFPVYLPPLRERGDDILALAQHFVDFFSDKMGVESAPLSREVSRQLLAYDYPGNVRELKNIIERAVILAESGRIELQHLPERVLLAGGKFPGPEGAAHLAASVAFVPGVDSLESFEQKLIRRALAISGGARQEAARLLGISRFQLRRRLQKYGMEASRTPAEGAGEEEAE
jgi:two-component system response regulator AtoC